MKLTKALALMFLSSITLVSQTIVGGKTTAGQTTVNGTSTVNSSFSRNIQIYVVFPPASSGPDYSSFRMNVANQTAIDGFTVKVDWSTIEPTAPTNSSSNCVSWTGQNSDICVLDAVGQYHSYSWGNVDVSGGTSGIWQWFDGFPGPKKVNILFFGMSGASSGVQNTTPDYVTNPSYVGLFSTVQQDVINNIQNACTNWVGHSMSVNSMTRTAPSSIVHVTLSGNTYMTGDTIWVNNTGVSDFNTTTGTQITVDSPGSTFHYTSTGSTTASNTAGGNLIAAAESWIVPYELPYKTAYRSALTALFLHFNAGYTVSGSPASSQLGYIRFGHSVGAEAFAYCTSVLSGYSAPYTYTPDSAASAPGCTEATCVGWTGDYYAGNMAWAQSQHPFMQIFGPLNQVNSDVTYGQREATACVASTNGAGFSDGLGSQGLSMLDFTPVTGTACSSTSDWCSSFTTYKNYAAPRELQQISISDPNDTTCDGHCSTCTAPCGIPPGDSGDLTHWLASAVTNHLTVLELYYRDAGLAYDPNYCQSFDSGPPPTCPTGYSLGNGTGMLTSKEYNFYNSVGQGSNCSPQVIHSPQGAGNCAYANAINTAHGLNPP